MLFRPLAFLAAVAVVCAAWAPSVVATRDYCFNDDLVAFYPFDKGFGTRSFELSRFTAGSHLHLELNDASKAEWVRDDYGRGMRFNATGGVLATETSAYKLTEAIRESGQLTVEAWVVAGEDSPAEGIPARIVALTGGTACPNLQSFVLGQTRGRDGRANLDYRLRTTATRGCNEVWHQWPVLPLDELVHLAITWDGENKRVYVNGTLAAIVPVGGTAEDWDDSYRLTVGNEDNAVGRAWLGTVYKVAVWKRALGVCEIKQLVEIGTDGKTGDVCVPDDAAAVSSSSSSSSGRLGGGGRHPTTMTGPTTFPRNGVEQCDSTQSQEYCWDSDLLVYYTFDERGGATVRDRAPVGEPLDLIIRDPGRVSWIGSNGGSSTGLRFTDEDNEIVSQGPASKVSAAIKETHAFTVEVWLKTFGDRSLRRSDGTPGRVVTLGNGTACPDDYSFYVGMSPGLRLDFRAKTDAELNDCGADGRQYPLVEEGRLVHVVATWSQEDGFKRVYVNGDLAYVMPFEGSATLWDAGVPLRLGNSAGLLREWEGEYRKLAIWKRALRPCEAAHLYSLGERPTAFCDVPAGGEVSSCEGGGAVRERPHCFDDSLLAFYPFDEGAGVLLHDRAPARDGEEPVDLRLSDPSSVSWQEPNGIRFARRNAVAQSFLPASKILRAWNRTGELTVEMWVRATDKSPIEGEPARILGFEATTCAPDDTAAAGGADVVIGHTKGGHLDFLMRMNTTGEGGTCGGVTDSYAWALRPDNAKMHVVVTYSGGRFKSVYVNGDLYGVEETDGGVLGFLDASLEASQLNHLRLGNAPGLDRDWKGTLYKLAFYDRSLAPCEVKTLHGLTRDSSTSCPDDLPVCALTLPNYCFSKDLVAYYPMDEGEGERIHDRSGVGLPVDLFVSDAGKVEWNPDGSPNGVRFVEAGAAAASAANSQTLAVAFRDSGAFTLSVWATGGEASDASEADRPAAALFHAGVGDCAGAGGVPSAGSGGPSLAVGQAGARDLLVSLPTDELPVCAGVADEGGNGTALSTSFLPADGAEHHLVVQFVGCELRFYRDGERIGSLPHEGTLGWDPAALLRLGNDHTLRASWLGTLRSVALWRRALTAGEVAQLYSLGSGPGLSCACTGASLLDDGAFLVRTPGANRGGEFMSSFQPRQVNVYNRDVPRKYMEFNLTSAPCEGRDLSVDCFGFQAISAEVWSRQIFQYGDVVWTSKAEARSGAVSSVFTFHGTSTDNGPVYSIIMSWAGLERNKIVCNIKTWDADLGIYDNFEYVDVPFDWSAGEHEYRIRWRAQYVEWYADGVRLRRVDEDKFGVFGQLSHIPFLGARVMAHSWSVDSGLFISGFRDFTGPYDPTDLESHYFWIYCPTVEEVTPPCCLLEEGEECPEPEAPNVNGAFNIVPADAGAESGKARAARWRGRRRRGPRAASALAGVHARARTSMEALRAEVSAAALGEVSAAGRGAPPTRSYRGGRRAPVAQELVETDLGCFIGDGTGQEVPCINDTQCLPPAPPPSLIEEESGLIDVNGSDWVQLTFEASLQYTSVTFQFIDGESECATFNRPTVWSAYLSGDKPCVTTYQALLPFTALELEKCGFVMEDIEEVRLNVTRFVAAVLATTTEPVSVDVDDQLQVTKQTAITTIITRPRGDVSLEPGDVDVYSDTQFLSFASLTRQIFDPVTETAYVRLVTAAVWPHYLVAKSVGTADSFDVPSITEVTEVPCTTNASVDNFCVQEWHIPVLPLPGQCNLNADIFAEFFVPCFGPPIFTSACPSVDGVTQVRVDFQTKSEEYCAIVVDTGDVTAAIGSFSDALYTFPETNFRTAQRAYFSTWVQGDLGVEIESTTLLRIVVSSGASDRVLYDLRAATAVGSDSLLVVQDVVPGQPSVSRFNFVLTVLNLDFTDGTVQIGAVSADLEVRYAVRSLNGLSVERRTAKLSAIFGEAAPLSRAASSSVSVLDTDGEEEEEEAEAAAATAVDTFVSATSLPAINILVVRDAFVEESTVFGLPQQAVVASLVVFVLLVLLMVATAGVRQHRREQQRRAAREARRTKALAKKRADRAAATGRGTDEMSVSSVDRNKMRNQIRIADDASVSGSAVDSIANPWK